MSEEGRLSARCSSLENEVLEQATKISALEEKLTMLAHYVAAHEEELAEQRAERAKEASTKAVTDALEQLEGPITERPGEVHKFTNDGE